MSALAAVAASVPVGVVAGRLARRAADLDRARRLGAPATRGWGIELVTTVILAVVAVRFGLRPTAAPYVVVVTALVAVTVTDLRDHRVPNRVIHPAMAASAVTMAVAATVLGEPVRLAWAAAGAAGFSATLGVIHLLRPDGLGRGDVKLAVVLGAALGWLSPPWPDLVLLVAWSLASASALGLVLALAIDRLGRPGRHDRSDRSTSAEPRIASGGRAPVPFAPSLSAATIGVVLLADVLVS